MRHLKHEYSDVRLLFFLCRQVPLPEVNSRSVKQSGPHSYARMSCRVQRSLYTSLCRHPRAGSAILGTSMVHAICKGSRTCTIQQGPMLSFPAHDAAL